MKTHRFLRWPGWPDPEGPPVFRCWSPVGPKRKSHLSANGTRKLEILGQFLMSRDQILQHLDESPLLLRFRGGSQKVVWAYMPLEGTSSFHRKVNTAQNWFYRKTLIPGMPPPLRLPSPFDLDTYDKEKGSGREGRRPLPCGMPTGTRDSRGDHRTKRHCMDMYDSQGVQRTRVP